MQDGSGAGGNEWIAAFGDIALNKAGAAECEEIWE